jgi:hypothetical protein
VIEYTPFVSMIQPGSPGSGPRKTSTVPATSVGGPAIEAGKAEQRYIPPVTVPSPIATGVSPLGVGDGVGTLRAVGRGVLTMGRGLVDAHPAKAAAIARVVKRARRPTMFKTTTRQALDRS